MQTWGGSVTEEVSKRVLTFAACMSIQPSVLSYFGYKETPWDTAFYLTLIFVSVSLTIGILIRRGFAAWG